MLFFRIPLFIVICVQLTFSTANADEQEFLEARREMVQLIEGDVRATRFYIDKTVLNAKVMAAMASVPRHEFVLPHDKKHAYENRPLPIGHGQTISQPYIVALMTDLLELSEDDILLEIGTGSGYQAAVAARLVQKVYTIEIVPPLAKEAGDRFQKLEINNVVNKLGDGYYGWAEHGPFDAIIVTAAASHIPPPLVRQLKKGGRMVIPVGSRFQTQQLLLITKGTDGQARTRQILPVRFVPLTGSH